MWSPLLFLFSQYNKKAPKTGCFRCFILFRKQDANNYAPPAKYCLSYDHEFDTEDLCDLGNGICVVADTQSIVVGRAFHNPALNKVPGVRLKEASCVGISSGRNGTFLGVTFTDHKLKAAFGILSNAQYVNLGFSGSALAEDAIAQYLAGLDMSVFVCDYDHNVPDAAYLRQTHFRLYETIRKAQPELPIIFLSAPCILLKKDPFTERRKIIYDTYQAALNKGDKNVYFIGGEELFAGDGWDSCTVDGTHPNDLGFYRMAMRIEKTLISALAK